MRLPKKVIIIAFGTMLAGAGAIYAAPSQRFDGNARQEARSGEALEHQGQSLIRQGEHLEKAGQVRRGEALERRGHYLVRKGERMERQGRLESR